MQIFAMTKSVGDSGSVYCQQEHWILVAYLHTKSVCPLLLDSDNGVTHCIFCQTQTDTPDGIAVAKCDRRDRANNAAHRAIEEF